MSTIIPPFLSDSPPPLDFQGDEEEDEDDIIGKFHNQEDNSDESDIEWTSPVVGKQPNGVVGIGKVIVGCESKSECASDVSCSYFQNSGPIEIPEPDLAKEKGFPEPDEEKPGPSLKSEPTKCNNPTFQDDTHELNSDIYDPRHTLNDLEVNICEETFSAFQGTDIVTDKCDQESKESCAVIQELAESRDIYQDSDVLIQEDVSPQETSKQSTVFETSVLKDETLVFQEFKSVESANWTESDVRTSPEGADVSEELIDEFADFQVSADVREQVIRTPDDDFADFETAVPSKEETDEFDDFAEPVASVPLTYLSSLFVDDQNLDVNEDNVSLSQCLLGCLDDSSSVWGNLKDLDVSPALNLHWANSSSSRTLLSSLNIDSRNILIGSKWNKSMPRFAANLGCAPLEPMKAESTAAAPVASATTATTITTTTTTQTTTTATATTATESTAIPSNTIEDVVPAAQFDWISSGLINPLDCFSKVDKEMTTPTVKQEVSSGEITNKPILSAEACKVLDSIPDLSFLSARKLLCTANENKNRFGNSNTRVKL